MRVRVNGEIYEVAEVPDLDRYKMHTIEAVIDRIVVRQPTTDENGETVGTDLTRLATRWRRRSRWATASLIIVADVTDRDNPKDRTFSEHFACVKCGTSLPEIEPRTFSFNSPHGACPTCTGLGVTAGVRPGADLRRGDDPRATAPSSPGGGRPTTMATATTARSCRPSAGNMRIPFRVPVKELSLKQREIILWGPPKKGERSASTTPTAKGRVATTRRASAA